MQKIKILMQYNNYAAIGNTHIFFDFNNKNLNYLISLKPFAIKKIHIYLSGHHSVNDSLRKLIHLFGSNPKQRIKIILHIYKAIKEIKPLILKYLDGIKGYSIIIEKGKKPNIFKANLGNGYTDLVINFNKGGYNIQIKRNSSPIQPVKIVFHTYLYNPADIDKEIGIFESVEERINPDQFCDKIIDAFKKKCPEKILKSFKGDQDIWDYIMKQGEWKVK